MESQHGTAYYRTSLANLSPTVDNLRLMLGATRHAFNRSSLAELEEILRLQDIITLDLDEFFEDVELAQAQPGTDGNPYLKKIAGILSHLEHMANELKLMGDPIRRKIKEATLVSDNDFFHLNNLFTNLKGLLRGLADLFHAENKPLKRYLLSEANNLIEGCFKAGVEHDLRMAQSFGQPHAFAIYLEILNKFKLILNHLIDIVKIVDEKPARPS
jgi:Na+/phosphate symporter